MAEKPIPPLHDPAIAEEARRLTEEAMEDLPSGNEEAAQFVINEIRTIDSDAVDEVLREQNADKSKER